MPSIADGIDIVLKDWATERQSQYIDFINEHLSLDKAAIHFNVSPRSYCIRRWFNRMIVNAAQKLSGG